MPTLVEINCSYSSSANGSLIVAIMRSASVAGLLRCRAQSVNRTTNSSLPMRAIEPRLAEHLDRGARNQTQQLVAAGVAERVVDVLESVEVEEKQRDAREARLRDFDRVAQHLTQQRAVRQAGQRVVVSQRAQPHALADSFRSCRRRASRSSPSKSASVDENSRTVPWGSAKTNAPYGSPPRRGASRCHSGTALESPRPATWRRSWPLR